jgi:hypothetical protein
MERFDSHVEDALAMEHLSEADRSRQVSLYRSQLAREAAEYEPILDALSTQLVDGGVYDNQGLDALLDADCTEMICSDGASPFAYSGRDTGDIGAAVRSNDILMKRVRELVIQVTKLRKPAGGGGVYIASLAELPTRREAQQGHVTSWIDEKLAADIKKVRTDLDAFSETEVGVLMASGYIAAQESVPLFVPRRSPAITSDVAPMSQDGARGQSEARLREDWPFIPLIPILGMSFGDSVVRRKIGRQIEAAKYRFLRPFRISTWHLLLLPTWITAFIVVQWKLLNVRQILGEWWRELTAALVNASAAVVSNPVVESAGWIVLFAGGVALYIGLRYGAFDEQISRILEALIIPRNLFRRIKALVLSFITIPVRLIWIWIVDPLLQRSGNLAETLSARALTGTERSLRNATLIGLLPLAAVGLLTIQHWITHDAEGRTKLATTAWEPERCLSQLREQENEDGPGGSYVTIWDPYVDVERVFCARKWDPDVLKAVSEKLAVDPSDDPISASLRRQLLGESEEVDKFLIQRGAQEFVWFKALRRQLPRVYDVYKRVNATPQTGLESGDIAEATPTISMPWSAVVSRDADLGLVVPIESDAFGSVEIFQTRPRPVTLEELAVWLSPRTGLKARRIEIEIAPGERSAAEQFVSLVKEFAENTASTKPKASESNDGGLERRPKRSRALEIHEVSALPREMCRDAIYLSMSVVSCPTDDRVFVVRNLDGAGRKDAGAAGLLPNDAVEVVARLVATERMASRE